MAIPISASITAIPIEQEIRRKPNFTDFEKSFLILQYELYKPILGAKLCDVNMNRRKNEVWARITAEMNARNMNVQRTVKDVRKKWENIAAQCRKELADFRQNQGRPFVVPPPTLSLKVLELLDEITLQRNDEKFDGQLEPNDQLEPSALAQNEQFLDSGLGAIDCVIKKEYIEDCTDQSGDGISAVGFDIEEKVKETQSQPQFRPLVVSGVSSTSFMDSSASSSTNQSTSKSPNECVVGHSSGITVTAAKRQYSDAFGVQQPEARKDHCYSHNNQPNSSNVQDFNIDITANLPDHRDSNRDSNGCQEDISAVILDIKKMKRLKIQLETEKLILEKRKLELEIKQLENRFQRDGN